VTRAPNHAECTDFSGPSEARPHLAIERALFLWHLGGGGVSGTSSGGTPGISGEGGSGASGGISTGEAGGSLVGTWRGGTADKRHMGRISTKGARVLSHCARPNWNGRPLPCLKTLISIILCRVSFINATMWNTLTIRPDQTRWAITGGSRISLQTTMVLLAAVIRFLRGVPREGFTDDLQRSSLEMPKGGTLGDV
jgi:hypothetical protein